MYHRVLPRDDQNESWSHAGIIVDCRTFERHMQVLRRTFKVVSLTEFAESRVEPSILRRPVCLITFDDGWSDTYKYAWPIMQRHSIPAAVFLPVNYIDTGRVFWQERFGRDLHAACERALGDAALRGQLAEALTAWGMDKVLNLPRQLAKAAIADAVRTRKTDAPDAIRRMGETLATFAGTSGATDQKVDSFMTWAHVREMAQAGTTFGAHGSEHLLLTTMEHAEAEADIVRSREVLKNYLEADPIAFSYPNGNWNERVADIVRRTGFQLAFTTLQHRANGRFAMPRVNIHQNAAANPAMLMARIAGLF